jgi:hypothetical protein
MKTQNELSPSSYFFSRFVTIFSYLLFLNFFFFHSFGSGGFGIFALGTFLFLVFIFRPVRFEKAEYVSLLSKGIILSLFCLGILLRGNGFIQAVLVLASLCTLLVYAYTLGSGISMVRSLFELILAPLSFIKTYIKTFFKSIGIVFSGKLQTITSPRPEGEKNTIGKSLLIGFICGIFVIAVLISMFSSADPIFASFIRNILSADFMQHLFDRIFLTALLFVFLVPFLILKRDKIFVSPISIFKRWNLVHEMSVVMGLVALVMGLFLVVQWPYIFVKVPFETDLSKFGVATYSEYVRKGFGELLKIALFMYGLIWLGLVILRDNKSHIKGVLKYIQLVVLAEFVVFLISIFRRVWLYQEYHGWSLIRIYGSLFLIWILGITLFLGLRHFFQKKWVVGEILFSVFMLFFVGVFNVESFIVLSHPPTVNKRIDYVYLSRLSSDGTLGWDKAFRYSQDVINKYTSPTSATLHISANERKDIAYAGLVIRELLKNYKNLVGDFGTQEEKKAYLLSTYQHKDKRLSEHFLSNNNPKQKEEMQAIVKRINEDAIDNGALINAFYIPDYPRKYKFNINEFLNSGEDSFIEVPYSDSFYLKKSEKKGIKPSDSFIDKVYLWNFSSLNAYDYMRKNITYAKLLELDEKYFDLYSRIVSAPPNERGYEMDISLDSPLLD